MAEDSGEKSPSISRRDFLKVAAVGMAGIATPKGLSEIGKEQDTSKEIKVGNLLLTPIITEHTEKDWEEHGQEILSKLDQFQIVIPEYFPPEYWRLKDTPIMKASGYERQNGLFDHLSDNFLQSGKEVWVVDPAYSEAAIAFRPVANLPMGAVFGATGLFAGESVANTIEDLTEPREIRSLPKEERSERQEEWGKSKKIQDVHKIARGIGVAAGFVPSMLEDNFKYVSIENDFRDLMVAEALVLLGKRVDDGTKAAVIYPRAHWEEIERYLNDDELREETLKRYIAIKKIPIYTPMFETRHYKAENNQWTKLQGFSIDAK